MIKHRFVLTQEALTVELNGRTYCISNQQPNFKRIWEYVDSGVEAKVIIDLIDEESTRIRSVLSNALTKIGMTGRLTYDYGVVLYDGVVLTNSAAKKLGEMIQLGHDAQALTQFVERLMLNPDPAIIDNLYDFLVHGEMPLTRDGCFLAYKAVRKDYKDIHTGRFNNAVGQTLFMPRSEVNPDRNQTCSTGLHVCSFAYLPGFAHMDGHVMICKIAPEDVVAIPNDYNNTKMRTARYEVVGEVTSYYLHNHNVLADTRLAEERYQLFATEGPNDEYLEIDSFYTLAEARQEMDALHKDNWYDAYIIDTTTGQEYTA